MLRGMEFGGGSHINIPIAVLIWLMIYPMMIKIDFSSVLGVRKRPRGLIITRLSAWPFWGMFSSNISFFPLWARKWRTSTWQE
jgi:ACR3 family arsenite transporter